MWEDLVSQGLITKASNEMKQRYLQKQTCNEDSGYTTNEYPFSGQIFYWKDMLASQMTVLQLSVIGIPVCSQLKDCNLEG